MEGTELFPALDSKFEFIAMENPSLMRVRKHWQDQGFNNFSKVGLLDVNNVDVDILKRHGIWNKLTPEVQKQVENLTVAEKEAVHSLLEKARAGRKVKYPNVPKELVCTKCGGKIGIQPSILAKRVENLAKTKGVGYTVEDYVKTYECQTCHPTKGRRANPEFAKFPKELQCKCGNKVHTSAQAIIKAAVCNKVTTDEYIANYRCQVCNPTRGRHLRKDK